MQTGRQTETLAYIVRLVEPGTARSVRLCVGLDTRLELGSLLETLTIIIIIIITSERFKSTLTTCISLGLLVYRHVQANVVMSQPCPMVFI